MTKNVFFITTKRKHAYTTTLISRLLAYLSSLSWQFFFYRHSYPLFSFSCIQLLSFLLHSLFFFLAFSDITHMDEFVIDTIFFLFNFYI